MNRKVFYDRIRIAIFNGTLSQATVNGTEAILNEWDRQQLSDPRYLAYILGTTWWETDHTMDPIREVGSGRGHPYGVPQGPWHQVYYGRGDVQLTWEYNYRYATERLRAHGVIDDTIDLEKTPDLAMRPDIAAAILVYGMLEGWFTHRKLPQFFSDSSSNWIGAREIVNGNDHAHDIAEYSIKFYLAIKGAAA